MNPESPRLPRTVAELPFFAAGRFTKPDFLGQCRADGVTYISGRELVEQVRDLSLGLAALGMKQGDRIALLYLFDNELRTKIIQDDQVLEGKTVEHIKTSFDSDVVRNEQTSMNRLEYWYKDNFYAYGVQEIANAERGKRRVFFINKITATGTPVTVD